jgi:hypothetical protein
MPAALPNPSIPMTSEPVPAQPPVRAAGPVPPVGDATPPSGPGSATGAVYPGAADSASALFPGGDAALSRADAGRGSWLLASAAQRMGAAALVSVGLWGLTAWAMGWW